MTDYAEQIKSSVTMQQAIEHYGFTVNRAHKILCPFHSDKRNSCHIYKDGYKCFSCGAHGDVIDFVSRYFNLSFMDSVKKMNDDFSLGMEIGGTLTDEQKREANRQAYKRRQEQKRRQNELKRLYTAYSAAYDWYAALDIIKLWDAPKGPYDEITPQYAYACQHIDAAWEDVQDAAERLREFEKKER